LALSSLVSLVIEGAKLWLLVKPYKRFKAWRAKRRGVPVQKWLQSRTIQGLAASGIALVLGFVVGDADSAALAERVTTWLLEGVQVGGLIYAARGRKLADGPL
jgi:hypothetical protein